MTSDPELEAFYRLIAPYYDLDYAGLWDPASVDFYIGIARESAGPVLELGCGTGRVLLPLARAGFTVHGVDCSLDMLEKLQANLDAEPDHVRRRVTFTRGDIRSHDTGRRFALVISAGNVIHSFLKRRDQRAFLRNARRHLAPGGAFCFDVFQFNPIYLMRSPDEWELDVDRIDPVSGHRIRRLFRLRQEPRYRRFRVEMKWLEDDAAGNPLFDRSGMISQRWFRPDELRLLMEQEGFRITDYWGTWAREPFGKDSPEQLVRAVAAP